jgi:hypothetical protein
MYRIICIDGGEEHILLDMDYDGYIVQSPVLILELNGAGSLSFTIHPTHPEFGCLNPITSLVKVYRVAGSKNRWIFTGRVMSSKDDIENNGNVECEGILAYLCDSIVRNYEFSGTPADYIIYLVDSHNEQVDDKKKFTIRDLDVSDVDSNNYITRANSNYPTTFTEMTDKVVKLLDTYISVTDEGDEIYFDCVQTISHINSQAINFGENIIDLERTVTAEELKTVMVGIGAADDDGNKPTVEVENTKAIGHYGRIVGTVEFEDVTTIEQLEKKTKAYLDSVLGTKNTIEVKAVDLNMTDTDIEEISLGYAYVTSEINGIYEERMIISKMQLYLLQPENNTFTLDSTKTSISSTLVHSNAEIKASVSQVAKTALHQIETKVANATQLITGAKGGYVVLDCGDNADQHPEQILIMDAPDKKDAVNVIRINKNGIGFSTSGYDGIYRNAWTIDGNLVADFITTGTMLADRISGGTLTLGGYDNVNGVFYVKDKDGVVRITEDVNGINVNNNFKVDMNGNIEAVSISGGAIDQFSQLIDDSQAMKTAKDAIATAQSAADTANSAAATAQSTADTANRAAATAQSAADTANSAAADAKSAAEKAQKAINDSQTDITFSVNSVNTQNTWIRQLSSQIQALGQPGIS